MTKRLLTTGLVAVGLTGFVMASQWGGRALRFARTVPGTQGLAELQTFSCRECSLWITESADEHPSWNRSKSS
jgi:hypothetical protein